VLVQLMEFWREIVLFLHDNHPDHRAFATERKLAYLGFHCLDNLPYSLGLAPSDFHLLPALTKQLKSHNFSSAVHCCRGHLVRRTTFWTFFSGLQKIEQRAKMCFQRFW
jgi:hypothetical protein